MASIQYLRKKRLLFLSYITNRIMYLFTFSICIQACFWKCNYIYYRTFLLFTLSLSKSFKSNAFRKRENRFSYALQIFANLQICKYFLKKLGRIEIIHLLWVLVVDTEILILLFRNVFYINCNRLATIRIPRKYSV